MRPYEYFDDVHIAIAYEFDLNLYRIDREAYNLLDWLGDIGGLLEALLIILGFVFGVFKYHAFEDYLVSQLYRAAPREERNMGDMNIDDSEDLYAKRHEGIPLNPNKVNCLAQRVHDCGWNPSRLRKTTHERLFEKGRELLSKEIDIARFLQQFRRLERIISLKISLTSPEKLYVENNRFAKLQLSDDVITVDDGYDTSAGAPNARFEQSSNGAEEHERRAMALFRKKQYGTAKHPRKKHQRVAPLDSTLGGASEVQLARSATLEDEVSRDLATDDCGTLALEDQTSQSMLSTLQRIKQNRQKKHKKRLLPLSVDARML